MRIIYILSALILLSLFSSCDKTRHNRAHNFVPDMFYSRAYETYAENPNYGDSASALKPVEGTIPRGIVPYAYPNTPEGKEAAGKELKNPIEFTAENLERGALLYQRFCIHCHGESGDGQGHLFTSGKYTVMPRTLIDDELKNRPEGQIFHVITRGSAVMGPHASQIAPEDRWKIVHYVKEVLQKSK